MYFSDKKALPTKISNDATPKKPIKETLGMSKSTKGLMNMNPYYKEILNHNKSLSKSQSNKEINVKTC